MDSLYEEMKWINMVHLLIAQYSTANRETLKTDVENLFFLIPKINPLILQPLLELYLECSVSSHSEREFALKFFIDELNKALLFTDDHKKVIKYFEVVGALYAQRAGESRESFIYTLMGDRSIEELKESDFLKKKYFLLLLEYFEMKGDYNKARDYAYKVGDSDRYVTYALVCNNIYRIDGEINNEVLRKYYHKIFEGEYNFFLGLKDGKFTRQHMERLIEKARIVFILKKAYRNCTISISELGDEMELSPAEVMVLLYKAMANKYLYGYINNDILSITGTKNVSELERLKSEFVRWRDNIRRVRETLIKNNIDIK